MDARIRTYEDSDEEAVVEFGLRSWAPVFDSIETVLGRELFVRLHPDRGDWRSHQQEAIRQTLSDASMHTWVAVVGAAVAGFVSARLTGEAHLGEIFMLAVDPDHQGAGVGTALTEVATDWLCRSGARVAMIDTGGDPGHAPARRVYEKAAYTALPITRYLKAL